MTAMEPRALEAVAIASEGFSVGEEIYRVYLRNHAVDVSVTCKPRTARAWVEGIQYRYRNHSTPLVVGVGVQCSTSQPNVAAIVQVCVGDRCLIFQIAQAEQFPSTLRLFLSNRRHIYVGFWNQMDRYMLASCEHDVEVMPLVELREVAVVLRGCSPVATISEVASEILKYNWIEMDDEVARSDWSVRWLTQGQVKYATLDVFLAYLVAMELQVWATWPNHARRH